MKVTIGQGFRRTEKEMKIQCACGCGETFLKQGGKKYVNLKHRRKAKSRKYYEENYKSIYPRINVVK